MNNNSPKIADMIWYANRAMIGEISSPMRMITLKWDDTNIFLKGYIDGEITSKDRDSIGIIWGTIITDFVDTHDGNFEVIRYDYPKRLNDIADNGMVIYCRREEIPSDVGGKEII